MLNTNSFSTIYPMVDEKNKPSSISVFKLDADVLQAMEIDVHELIQKVYNIVSKYCPHKNRREKGNTVRLIVYQVASRQPMYSKWLNGYL